MSFIPYILVRIKILLLYAFCTVSMGLTFATIDTSNFLTKVRFGDENGESRTHT